ncbi:MAG: TonB family protein, partial [Cryomorphaceae bacterium]
TCAVKSGTFKTYTKQGVKLSEINYQHNDRIGPYTTWYESGAVNIQGQYGEAVEPEESDTDDYWNSQKASELLGSEEEEGVKIGRWEYYDSNGQLRAAEEYDNEGYNTSSRYWKSDGSTGHQGVTERSAYYPGSDKALIKFLGENIEFPEEDKLKGSSGEVLVSFLVNVDGDVTDFRVERSASPTMDAECLRVLSEMPKWKPAKRHNRNVDMRYFLPIRFTSLTRRGQKELIEKVHQENDGKLYWAQ